MIWLFVLLLSLVSYGIFVDIPTMLHLLLTYSVGVLCCLAFGGKEKKTITHIYSATFSLGSIYMLMTFLYMISNNYKLLLSYDSYYYFLPTTENYLIDGNYWNTLKIIWENYDFFNRFQAGYFSYATLFGYFSKTIGSNFYLGQQASVLFLFSFVSIMLYKLLRVNDFKTQKAYKYTLIISVFSILFFYSSQVLRDIHILLLYLLGIYFTFKKGFSMINLFKIVTVTYLCTTIRLESGLFMFFLIPTYLLLSLQQSNKKIIATFISIIFAILLITMLIPYTNQIVNVVEYNQENYMDDKGNGIIGTLQKIPLFGDIGSVIYNAVQPVPLWFRFSTTSTKIDDQAVYNIMNFPRSFASFFNWMVIIYIGFWLFSKKIRKTTKGFISKPLIYQLWIGVLFLMLQSAVVSQRRLLAYYCIYYILFFIIYKGITYPVKKQINIVVISSFIFLQIIGFYLMQ